MTPESSPARAEKFDFTKPIEDGPAAHGFDCYLGIMRGDVSERRNLYGQQAQVVQQLLGLLKKYVANGRSTPGAAKKNDVPVKIWKSKPLSRDDDGKPITHD